MYEDYVFKSKPYEVRAFNIAIHESPDNVPDWLLEACKKGLAVRTSAMEKDTIRYKIHTLHGMGDWRNGLIGQWIICDETGALDIVDSLTLQNRFELVRKTTARDVLQEREMKPFETAKN
jgi:hypothetical protein